MRKSHARKENNLNRKHAPLANLEVRVKNRRGQEIAKALETDILPIQSAKGEPRRENVVSDGGSFWSYVADIQRLTTKQIQRIAMSLAKKYDDEPVGSVPLDWCSTDSMERIIRQHGFTVPVDDCDLVVKTPAAQQSSFLERSQPRDYEP